jgi:hypothetical protein
MSNFDCCWARPERTAVSWVTAHLESVAHCIVEGGFGDAAAGEEMVAIGPIISRQGLATVGTAFVFRRW